MATTTIDFATLTEVKCNSISLTELWKDGKRLWPESTIIITTDGRTCDASTVLDSDSGYKSKYNLRGLMIGNCVTEIDDEAFEGAFWTVGSVALLIPSNVQSVGARAFSTNGIIKSVVIEEGVTSLGTAAFKSCGGITTIQMPSSLQTIGDNLCFPSDTSKISMAKLDSITIPAGVTSIGKYAFIQVKTVTMLPTTPPTIGECAFGGSKWGGWRLTKITVPKGCGDAYKTADGWSTYTSYIVESET